MRQSGQTKKSTKDNLFAYTLVTAAFVVVQTLWMGPGVGVMLEGQLTPIYVYIVMALVLNLAVDVSGELSLGHAGFMSIGTSAGSALALALQSTVTLLLPCLTLTTVFGAIITAALDFLIGTPVLRLDSDYLVIVTLAFGETIRSITTNVYLGVDENDLQFSFSSSKNELADGGMEFIRSPMGMMNIQRVSTFVTDFILVLVALVAIFNLVNNRTGQAVMATRDNRIAVGSTGISVTKYRMIVFAVSTALVGAVGTLCGCSQTTFVAVKFGFNAPTLILVFTTLGGLGSMWGSIIATAALTVLPKTLCWLLNYRMLVYATVLALAMLATNNPTLKGPFSRLFHRERADVPRAAAVKEGSRQ